MRMKGYLSSKPLMRGYQTELYRLGSKLKSAELRLAAEKLETLPDAGQMKQIHSLENIEAKLDIAEVVLL